MLPLSSWERGQGVRAIHSARGCSFIDVMSSSARGEEADDVAREPLGLFDSSQLPAARHRPNMPASLSSSEVSALLPCMAWGPIRPLGLVDAPAELSEHLALNPDREGLERQSGPHLVHLGSRLHGDRLGRVGRMGCLQSEAGGHDVHARAA
jgi:hypothetical protein